ncbi:hypothetical protein [Elioraea sp.]|jgi:hypothetical protein|uniref:hypothetical protein n=1 Tax=Elioraea sp. TaxID=2185103 RepID=UPI0025B93B31|nr:hypothetical protein [Elioraea sp.]
MPFDVQKLSVLAYANGFTLWHYRNDADSRAAILAPGYFDSSAHLLRRGDMLLTRSSDSFAILHVTTNTGTSVSVSAIV